MVGAKGRGLLGFKDWIIDNLISRGVGFVVRVVMIILFVLVFLCFLIFAITAVIFWILMPGIVVASFIYIFTGK